MWLGRRGPQAKGMVSTFPGRPHAFGIGEAVGSRAWLCSRQSWGWAQRRGEGWGVDTVCRGPWSHGGGGPNPSGDPRAGNACSWGDPAEGPAPACRASPAFRGTASTPLPSAEAPLPSVCRLCPPGQQSCRERGVPAWCVWGGGSAASIWLPARPAPCVSRCSTFPAASSCQPGLRPTGSGRLGLSEDSPSLGAHRGGFLAFPLVPAGR